MIKKAKKSVAVGLSVALAVTSVNIPVNSASAAAKKAKLSATKKTLTAGKSTTLTLKTNKKKAKTIKSINAKYVKVSTSKKSVATVKKVSKKSKFTGVKVTAKKAGKSTITVKVTKGTYKGTYKCAVTVKKKASATKAPTKAPTEAPTATPEVTAEPTVEPTQEPTAEPTTAPAITQTPIVQEVTNVNAIVTNSVKGYDNTVLAGQDATIQVLVTDKQGNPVANDNVVLRFSDDSVTAPGLYGNQGNPVATTNSKGIATFVVGPNKNNIKNTNSDYLGSYTFKVTEATENISAEGKLDVATISYASSDNYSAHWWEGREADVLNLNGTTAGYKDIVPATNVTKSDAYKINGSKNVAEGLSEYVSTQQVSTTGEDHKVAFKTSVYLNIPKKTNEQDRKTSHVQSINKQSGSYETYDEKVVAVPFEIKDMNSVNYATLAFNSVSVSQYSELNVYTYYMNNGSPVMIKKLDTYGTATKNFKQSNFGLQIAKEDLIKSRSQLGNSDPNYSAGDTKKPEGVYIVVKSKGQVNAADNSGFDVKDLTYVYGTKTTVDGNKVLLKDTSIKWESVKPVYSKEEEVTTAEKTALGLDSLGYASVTKTIPVFPYVGNAIIKCYDANKNIVRYYACATKNNGNNVNVLDTSAGNFYIISEDEATKSVGTVTDKGDGTVEVDSKQTGTTYLVGTVACNDENVNIDANNEKVYTSVMWNPVAEKTATVTRDRFAAVEGQSITLKAQLVDANNNPVSRASRPITWSGIDDVNGKVTKVVSETTTNAQGQAVTKLSAADACYLQGISAKDSEDKYKVVLLLGDKQVSIADLYWISLGLQFTPSVQNDATTTTLGTANGTANVTPGKVTVGETWKYAAQVVAEGVFGNALTGDLNNDFKFTGISGIGFNVNQASGSTGTVTVKDGVATVSSNTNGTGKIVNKLDSSVVTKGATVTFANKYNSGWSYTLAFVGEGSANVDEELTINYEFNTTNSYSASFVTPTGTSALAGASKDIYVKVVDAKGNAKAGVTVTLTNASAKTATTDDKGIAKITVPAGTAGKSTTVIAKAGDATTISTIINWRDAVDFAIDKMSYDSTAKTIKLSFNNDVYANSVIAKEFEVTFKPDTKATTGKTYDVTVSSVSGKDIVLALPSYANIDWSKEACFDVKVSHVNDNLGVAYAVSASKSGESVADNTIYGMNGSNDTVTVNGVVPADATAANEVIDAIKGATFETYSSVKTSKYDAASPEVKAIVDSKLTIADYDTEYSTLNTAATAYNTAKASIEVKTNTSLAAVKTAVETAVTASTNNLDVVVTGAKGTAATDYTDGSTLVEGNQITVTISVKTDAKTTMKVVKTFAFPA